MDLSRVPVTTENLYPPTVSDIRVDVHSPEKGVEEQSKETPVGGPESEVRWD